MTTSLLRLWTFPWSLFCLFDKMFPSREGEHHSKWREICTCLTLSHAHNTWWRWRFVRSARVKQVQIFCKTEEQVHIPTEVVVVDAAVFSCHKYKLRTPKFFLPTGQLFISILLIYMDKVLMLPFLVLFLDSCSTLNAMVLSMDFTMTSY